MFDCWIALAQRFGMSDVAYEGETCTLLQVLVTRNIRARVQALTNQLSCRPDPNMDKSLRFAAQ